MNNTKSTCSSIWINQSLYSNHGIKIQKKENHARDWYLHANMNSQSNINATKERKLIPAVGGKILS